MGFFGTYLFEGGKLSESEDPRMAAEPWLFLNIYDSDIATVMYGPSGPATGMVFLGVTPRSFFDDASASVPTDVDLEARGLADWWSLLNPADEPVRAAKQAELRSYLAPDTDPYAEFEDKDADQLDDADIFVEVKAGRFLAALGLPPPDDLRRAD